MRPFGRGILPQSQIYLYDASPQAKRMYFYALCIGHYECSEDYVVNRQSFDSFLLLYIKRGHAYYVQDGQKTELHADSFAIIDCYKPHEYGAIGSCEMYWIHYDGPTARAVSDSILENGLPVPKHFERARRSLLDICNRTASSGLIEEAEMNKLIVNLLTEFLVRVEQRPFEGNDAIEEIRNYILENPDKNLTLENLAKRANLSPYHFARLFKRQVGTTPHDYLIHTRLNLAKFYLLSTTYSVKEIAYSCGFSNECSFCTCFKNRTGMTPTAFRTNRS